MSDIKLKQVVGFETQPYGGGGKFTFRLEKRKGRFTKGMQLKKSAKAYALYKTISGKPKFKLGFLRKKGAFIPAVTKNDNGYITADVVAGKGSKCEQGIVPIAKALKGVEVLETRVGYFNADKLLDIAYTVRHPQHGEMTYILYGDKLYRCVARDGSSVDKEAGSRFENCIRQYIKLFDGISPNALRKIHDFARLAVKREIESRDAKSAPWMTLSDVIEYSQSFFDDKTRAKQFVDDVLTLAGTGRVNIVRMISDILKGRMDGKSKVVRDIKTLMKLGRELTVDQFRALECLYKNHKIKDHAKTMVVKIRKLMARHSGTALYKKVYKLFGGFHGMAAETFASYAEIMRNESDLHVKDIRAAEASVGAKGAVLLFKKFKLTRFGRYHSSMLKHMVKLAKNPKHMRDKPLIFATTARADDSNAFYWGKGFKHDPRARVIVIEANNYEEFREMAWKIRREYGIPDSMLVTAHGAPGSISMGHGGKLGKGWEHHIKVDHYKRMKEDFKNFFGGKKGLIVVNACYAGAREGGNAMNIGQMFANAFNAEVRAARALEALLSLSVHIDKQGRARLEPMFFEVGKRYFGLNPGGSVFLPNKTGKVPERVYNGAADANTGWKVGAGLSTIGRDLSLDMFVGYSKAFWHRLRLRADLGVHYHPIKGAVSTSFDPEVAVGIVNQFLVFGGGRFGATVNRAGQVKPLYQADFGFKFLVPHVNLEIDIGGASVNGSKPKFFFKFQGRF